MKKQAILKQIKLAFISLTGNNPRKFDKKPNAADTEFNESIAVQGIMGTWIPSIKKSARNQNSLSRRNGQISKQMAHRSK